VPGDHSTSLDTSGRTFRPTTDNLPESVRALRKSLNLTQHQLAERLGVTYVTVSRWETGQVRPNRLALRSLSRVAETALGHEVDACLQAQRSDGVWPRGAVAELPLLGRTLQSGTEAFQDRPTHGPEATPFLENASTIEALRASPIFSDLDDGALEDLSRFAHEHRLKAGQFLFFEGDLLACFYVVVSGKCKIVKHSPSGRDFIMAFAGPGEMLGNALLFFGKPHPSSVQAISDISVLSISNDDLMSFLSSKPELSVRILGRMLNVAGRRLLDAAARLSEMAAEGADYRLAHVLYTLCLEFGASVPFTRREIAEMAGTTTETAIRFVSRLKKKGVVRPLRGTVNILDQSKLRLLAEGLLLV